MMGGGYGRQPSDHFDHSTVADAGGPCVRPLVGLVAGILPANKAVKISALEAIRHD